MVVAVVYVCVCVCGGVGGVFLFPFPFSHSLGVSAAMLFLSPFSLSRCVRAYVSVSLYVLVYLSMCVWYRHHLFVL